MRMIHVLLAATAVAAATPALAQTDRLTIGVTGGTLGVGPEITYKPSPIVAVRASATWLDVSGSGNVSGYRYRGDAHLSNWGGTVDVHPFRNGFRISAGARSTDDQRISFYGRPTRDQVFGGRTVSATDAGTVAGRIETDGVAPITTIGWTHSVARHLVLGVDAGVMFHGRPDVDRLDYTGELATNAFATPERDRQAASLRDRVSDYRYYPVAQLSLGWRF